MTNRLLVRAASRTLAVVVPLVILVIAAWQYRWMSDDGFINLRIVRNIASGHGPVFNAGERVEASTSALWVWLLWVGDVLLPLRLEWIAVLVGIGLSVGGLAAACLGARRLHETWVGGSHSAFWTPVGALILVGIAPMWKFSSSGLENGLSFAWIGAAFLGLATWSRTDRPARRGLLVLVGLGPLVRPEFAILSALLIAVILIGDPIRRRGRAIAAVGVACAVPFAYEIFRMGYYSSLIPNSALAKEAGRPYWSPGWAYLRETVNPYWLWFPLVVLVAGAYAPTLAFLRGAHQRRGGLVLVAFPAAGCLTAAYIVRVGGDFMQARLLLPALFMVAAPVAVMPLRRATAVSLLVVPWAVIAIATLRSGADQPQAFDASTRNAVTVEDFAGPTAHPFPHWFDGNGVYFLDRKLRGAPKAHDPAVAMYGVGVIGYALGPDTYVLDLLGLGDAFTAHLRLDRRGTIAHEKPLPFPWIVARLVEPGASVTAADFELPSFFLARPIDRPAGARFRTRVADARVALRCPELREFLDRITAPLDIDRFLRNIVAAPANTQFRIPPEPREARRQFCAGRRRGNT